MRSAPLSSGRARAARISARAQPRFTAVGRARAIESQCYVIAAGQWGRHPRGRASFGHSLIADPWGTIVAECADRVGFASADIERGDLERVRASLPSLRHRRL